MEARQDRIALHVTLAHFTPSWSMFAEMLGIPRLVFYKKAPLLFFLKKRQPCQKRNKR
jgi:hypothetical protein